MISNAYEAEIRSGLGLETVLAERLPEEKATVVDAVKVWLEETSTSILDFDEQAIREMLSWIIPELVNAPEITNAISIERDRLNGLENRSNLSGRTFGPIMLDCDKHRYELKELVGSGGQGQVYRAVDREFEGAGRSMVAIKVLKTISEFNESLNARSIEHPNVLRVHDRGQDTDAPLPRPYIVYEYLDGPRLDDWIADKRLTQQQIAQVMMSLCDGATAIHAQSIVHCDIKPANIIMMGDRPVIADFGISKNGNNDTTPPAGSIGFMAPEQRGQSFGVLADVYGLGAVLFFMLTGRCPNGENNDEVDSHFDSGGTVDVSDVPYPRLAEIAQKCMESHVSGRYQSAHEIACDLRAVIQNRVNSAGQYTIGQKFVLAVRRNPIVLALGLFLVGLPTVAFVVQNSTIEHQSDRIEAASQKIGQLVDSQKRTMSVLSSSILDSKYRGEEFDPALIWSITELSRLRGEDANWSFDNLLSHDGVVMLIHAVKKFEPRKDVSTVTKGYWWVMLARGQDAVGDDSGHVFDSYSRAIAHFTLVLDESDPIVQSVIAEMESLEPVD